MKKLLLIFILLSSLSTVSNASTESVNTCNGLLKVYSFAVDAKQNKTDYTDLLYALTTTYEGDATGLYLIYQAARRAYNDIDETEGKKNFTKYCLDLLPDVKELIPQEIKPSAIKILV